jgi:hypothetical protein
VSDFRAAVEAKDIDGVLACLHEEVVFRSPIVFKPYVGRDALAPLLRAVAELLEDFRYTREIASDGGDRALVFQARVGDRDVEGCDFIHIGAQGLIEEFFVMVRPLSGALALAEAVARRLGVPAADAELPGAA